MPHPNIDLIRTDIATFLRKRKREAEAYIELRKSLLCLVREAAKLEKDEIPSEIILMELIRIDGVVKGDN